MKNKSICEITSVGYINCFHGNNKRWAIIKMNTKAEEDSYKTTIIITVEQTVESRKSLLNFVPRRVRVVCVY